MRCLNRFVYIFEGIEERSGAINKTCVEYIVLYYLQHMNTARIWLTISSSVCYPFLSNKLNVSFSAQKSASVLDVRVLRCCFIFVLVGSSDAPVRLGSEKKYRTVCPFDCSCSYFFPVNT